MNKNQELRDLSLQELEASLVDTRRALFEMINKKKQAKQLDKPHRLGLLRKEVARKLTILNERRVEVN